MLKLALLVALTLATEKPTATPFEAGVAALKAKQADRAIELLSKAAAADPRCVDCRWELGWAHYLKADWARVVELWEEVKRLNPRHPEVDRHLPAARAYLKAERAAASAASSAPATIEEPAAKPGRRVRIRAVGDIMLGTLFPEGYLPPEDGAGLLEDVGPWLRDADLTFANLEGPLCDEGETKKCRPNAKPGSCYAFRSPTRYGAHLKRAGIDMVSTANNHAEDFGVPCRIETEATLDKLGIAYSGRPGTVASLSHDGLKIAMIGFHSSRSGHYLNDHDSAAALVAGLAAEHDLVIVSFHGGAEGSRALHVPEGGETFYGEDRGDLRVFSHRVVDAGADLVIGHGPHVLRGMEIYRDRLIAYSLGNFATYGRFNLSGYLGVGAVLEVELDSRGHFVAGKLLPTRQDGKGVAVRDPAGKAIGLVRRLSKQDFPKHGVVVAKDGSIAAQR